MMTFDRQWLRWSVLGGVVLALLMCASSWAQTPYVLKFSHVVTADTPKGQAAERFRELVNARSNGRIRVEVYPNSTLYKDKEELEALQLGAVQMLAPSLSKFGPLGVRQFEIFDLPYLFPDEAAFARVTDGPIGHNLMHELESHGIKGLAFWSAGFHVYSANRLLVHPQDLAGLKMRIPSSKVLDASLRALGALPQVLPFSDVYQALQTGVVDGTENIPSTYTTQKYLEVQKFMALTYHTHTGYAVVINKEFFDRLPPELQAIVTQAVHEATVYEDQLVQKENSDALATIRASGKMKVIDLTDAQRAEWRRALLPVHKEMESRVGRDLMQSVYETAGTQLH